MLVSHILRQKGDMVFTVSPDDTVEAAARLLAQRGVGAAVVMGPDRKTAGIFSERDLARCVAERGGDALGLPVAELMTREVIFADPGETVQVLLERMTDRRVRHLPVCQGERLVGIVSIGDLVKAKIAETEAEAEGLKAYIVAG